MKPWVRRALGAGLILLIPCLTVAGVLYARRTIHPVLPRAEETVNSWVYDGERYLALEKLPGGGEELLELMEEALTLRLESWEEEEGRFFPPYYEISVNWQGGSLRLGFQAREEAVYTAPSAWMNGHTYRVEGAQALTAYLDEVWIR